ncbi:uncharacterized protein LOC114761401 [Neltuma alba]|uniref:uncharacterized protein LOC114761401 n=1 Tax=Neltuma alba TaxID=207710 RepID=UPI0010A4D25B|nr:uncharacterized protein LOC114761401 [Prosopis alba]XP_028806596.1 uncharacterized protein LOC114761401 [Prosopis alba]
MEYQNLGRQQRSKGANVKQALMVMLLVAGCAWLTYQINHSRYKPDDYGRLPKPVEQYWAVSLGRKGSPSWLYEIQFPTLGKVHIEEPKKDTNSGNTDDTASKSQSDDKGQGNVENSNIAVINDFESNEKEAEAQIRRNTESADGSIEEPNTLTGGVWAHTFDDENGVPPEVNGTETMGGVAQIDIVHGENISNDSKGNGAVKSNILGVTSSENDIVEVTFGGSKSIVVDAEVTSQSTIAHADT